MDEIFRQSSSAFNPGTNWYEESYHPNHDIFNIDKEVARDHDETGYVIVFLIFVAFIVSICCCICRRRRHRGRVLYHSSYYFWYFSIYYIKWKFQVLTKQFKKEIEIVLFIYIQIVNFWKLFLSIYRFLCTFASIFYKHL